MSESLNRQGSHPCNQLCDDMNVALMVIGYPSGTFLFVNKEVCVDLGLSYNSIIGHTYQEIFWRDFLRVYEGLAEQCTDGLEHSAVYYWTERVLWEQISAKMVPWDAENPPGEVSASREKPEASQQTQSKQLTSDKRAIVLTITNITEVARRQHEYEQAAFFDSNTELPNARRLELDIAALSSVEDVSMIYFQLGNYDDIVNLYGWSAGDYLHILIRDWLIESEINHAQFYKGDRGFILLGVGVKREDTIQRIESIIERFEHPWTVFVGENAHSLYCRIYIGGVIGEYVRQEIRTLLLRTVRMSDQTGNGYVIFDEKEDKRVKDMHRLRNELTQAIFDDMRGFSVDYQPIVEAKTGNWVGLEALCRWQAPSGDFVPPSVFIPVSEQLGFISKIDNWVRRVAMEQCAELGLHEKKMYLDVNYSPNQPINEAYVHELLTDIQETGFPAQYLILEITEAEKMPFDGNTLKYLDEIKQAGVLVSLDDFGSGYSSLENLLKTSSCTLKTNKALIERIEDDIDQQYLISVLIELAHHLDMRIIIEGVETEDQHKLIVELGADYVQGYLFSKPLTYEQLADETWRFLG